jgi:hypothetical protein
MSVIARIKNFNPPMGIPPLTLYGPACRTFRPNDRNPRTFSKKQCFGCIKSTHDKTLRIRLLLRSFALTNMFRREWGWLSRSFSMIERSAKIRYHRPGKPSNDTIDFLRFWRGGDVWVLCDIRLYFLQSLNLEIGVRSNCCCEY